MLWDVLATPAPDICDGSDDICFPIPMFFRFFWGPQSHSHSFSESVFFAHENTYVLCFERTCVAQGPSF